MYPLLLKPTIKDYIWGGHKLKTEYSKQSESNILAESWELSCHDDGMSIICNGELRGTTLQDFIRSDRKKVLGTNCDKFDYFPILVKLIDAKENLSIQVHPNNDYALENEGQYGKTEMWYVVDCEPNSFIYLGFNRDLSVDEFKERISNNTFLETLNAVKVKKGDVFFVQAGTLHAICSGILLAEVQQNSNITYRIYDYNRIGINDKPRELHVSKAVEVTNLKKQDLQVFPYIYEETENYSKMLLSKCEYFTTHHIEIKNEINLTANGESFHSFLCLDGTLNIVTKNTTVQLAKGQTAFIPASLGCYTIKGIGELLFITV